MIEISFKYSHTLRCSSVVRCGMQNISDYVYLISSATRTDYGLSCSAFCGLALWTTWWKMLV